MKGNGLSAKVALSVVVVAVLTLSVVPGTVVPARALPSFLAAAPHGAPGAAPSVASPTASGAVAERAPTAERSVSPSGAGPHPGTLAVYENGGGGTTMDPASAYNTINAEPIWNVYETLVAYNGTDTGSTPSNFVPQLATCVPGSAECVTQFGENLTFQNATNPANAQYYTFEIDAGARFYDPNTSANWPVYPSDVVFSLARTMAFAEEPFLEAYPGWIQSQALLPSGNSAWDGGVHYPFNNTPRNIMSAILVNDSTYCPAPKGSLKTNGCVTFNVGPSGFPWPNFLQFVADPMGGGVVPCGRFTAVGAPVPGFNASSAPNGDGTCTLPYGATSTSQSAYSRYLASLTPTAWDKYEVKGGDSYPSAQPAVQWQLIGSGPYYVYEVSASTGYFLRANPDYAAPVGCAGLTGCLPRPGEYIGTVDVYWDSGDEAGLQAMAGGQADTAGLFPADFAALQSLVSSGKYGLIQNIATLSFFFNPFELNFSTSAEAQIDSTGLLNVPGDWFSNVAIREFMVNAMPYTTLINYVYTSDGIATGESYGGVIPHGMGTYYPANVTWPSGNPVSSPGTVGNVTWWWKQATTPGTPWYDPIAAACTTSHPCQFPIISLTGYSIFDEQANLWIASIKSLSGGALQPYLLDIPPTTEAVSVGLPPGQGNMPDYPYGWAPDYPDPTDNVPTMFGPTGTYTVPDAVPAQLLLPAYMNPHASACAGHTTGLSSLSELVYWANVGQIPNACQGFAYQSMSDWIAIAGHVTDVTQRVLEYNLIEHIANELALYMYSNQGVGFNDYASWINPAGINTNPMIGGGGDQLWSFWTYSSGVYSVNITESGLAKNTNWSATLGATTQSATVPGTGGQSSIVFTGLLNDTYTYSVSFESGYNVSQATGTVRVNGANVTRFVTYTTFVTPTANVYFNETGLASNTSWSVVVTGYGGLFSNTPSILFALPQSNSYHYQPLAIAGFTSPGSGVVALGTTTAAVPLAYVGVTVQTFTLTFSETGLPGGSSWSVGIGPPGSVYTQTTTKSVLTFYETNGTYPVSFTLPSGYVAPASSATVTVQGAALNVPLPCVLQQKAFLVTFTEAGLPTATGWNVTMTDLTVGSNTTELNFTLANGTHPFTVSPPTGYFAIPPSGQVTVNGTGVQQLVLFGPMPSTFLVTFSAASLPSGSVWTVYVGSQSKTSAASQIQFLVANGTWTFAISAPSGYVSTPSDGLIGVNGAPTGVDINFAPTPTTTTTTSPAWSYLSTLAYALIGTLALLVVVGFALAGLFRGRRPPSAPESWTEGGGSAKDGGTGGTGSGGAEPPRT